MISETSGKAVEKSIRLLFVFPVIQAFSWVRDATKKWVDSISAIDRRPCRATFGVTWYGSTNVANCLSTPMTRLQISENIGARYFHPRRALLLRRMQHFWTTYVILFCDVFTSEVCLCSDIFCYSATGVKYLSLILAGPDAGIRMSSTHKWRSPS